MHCISFIIAIVYEQLYTQPNAIFQQSENQRVSAEIPHDPPLLAQVHII